MKEIHLEKIDQTRSSTPLSSIQISYQAIQNTSADLDQNPSPIEEYYPYMSPVWALDTPNTHDLLAQTFSSNPGSHQYLKTNLGGHALSIIISF